METHFAYVRTMANMSKIMLSEDNKSDENYSFNSTSYLQALSHGHTQWIMRYLDAGWDGYIFTIKFNNLPGSRKAKIIQMHQEVERIYRHLGTRTVRNPRSPKWAPYLPIGLFIPDLPVPKFRGGKKSTIADVCINDGLHMHGIVLANRGGRMRTGLHEHFRGKDGPLPDGQSSRHPCAAN